MDNHLIQEIINVPLIPVILLPVTGLALSVFYSRAATINQRIRLNQKEIREIFTKVPSQKDAKTDSTRATLESELKILTTRSHIIGFSLICCLTAICLFSLCAFFVALSMFYPGIIKWALSFWFIGPIFVCLGTLAGIIELFYSFTTLNMQSLLIQDWEDEKG